MTCRGVVVLTWFDTGNFTRLANGSRQVAREPTASAYARVDVPRAGRERCTVCACLQTDLFISTDTIHMTRKGDICHELSTCNWVTTGREADAVCTRRSGHVTVRIGSVVCSVNANPTLSRPDAYGSLESGTEPNSV